MNDSSFTVYYGNRQKNTFRKWWRRFCRATSAEIWKTNEKKDNDDARNGGIWSTDGGVVRLCGTGRPSCADRSVRRDIQNRSRRHRFSLAAAAAAAADFTRSLFSVTRMLLPLGPLRESGFDSSDRRCRSVVRRRKVKRGADAGCPAKTAVPSDRRRPSAADNLCGHPAAGSSLAVVPVAGARRQNCFAGQLGSRDDDLD